MDDHQSTALIQRSNYQTPIHISDGGRGIWGDIHGSIIENNIHIHIDGSRTTQSRTAFVPTRQLDYDRTMRDVIESESDSAVETDKIIQSILAMSKRKSRKRPKSKQHILGIDRGRMYKQSPRALLPPELWNLSEKFMRGVDAYIACSILTCDDQGIDAKNKIGTHLRSGLLWLDNQRFRLARDEFSRVTSKLGPPTVSLLLQIMQILTVRRLNETSRVATLHVSKYLGWLAMLEFGRYHPLTALLDVLHQCLVQDLLTSIPWGFLVAQVADSTAREPSLQMIQAIIFEKLFQSCDGGTGVERLHACVASSQQLLESCRLDFGEESFDTALALLRVALACMDVRDYDSVLRLEREAAVAFAAASAKSTEDDGVPAIEVLGIRLQCRWHSFNLAWLKNDDRAQWDAIICTLDELTYMLLDTTGRYNERDTSESITMLLAECEILVKDLGNEEEFSQVKSKFAKLWEQHLAQQMQATDQMTIEELLPIPAD